MLQIGAGSVVFESLAEGSVAVGAPARVVRTGINREQGTTLNPKLAPMDQGYGLVVLEYEI